MCIEFNLISCHRFFFIPTFHDNITLFISITMFCEITNIIQKKSHVLIEHEEYLQIIYGTLSVPHDIIMNPNNVVNMKYTSVLYNTPKITMIVFHVRYYVHFGPHTNYGKHLKCARCPSFIHIYSIWFCYRNMQSKIHNLDLQYNDLNI